MQPFHYKDHDGIKRTSYIPQTYEEAQLRVISEEVMEAIDSGKYNDQLPEFLLARVKAKNPTAKEETKTDADQTAPIGEGEVEVEMKKIGKGKKA